MDSERNVLILVVGYISSHYQEVNSTNVNTPPPTLVTLHRNAEKRCDKKMRDVEKDALRCANFML